MTGWTFGQVDDTPWPELKSLLAYWDAHPPIHEVVWIIGRDVYHIKEQTTVNTESLDDLGRVLGVKISRGGKPVNRFHNPNQQKPNKPPPSHGRR